MSETGGTAEPPLSSPEEYREGNVVYLRKKDPRGERIDITIQQGKRRERLLIGKDVIVAEIDHSENEFAQSTLGTSLGSLRIERDPKKRITTELSFPDTPYYDNGKTLDTVSILFRRHHPYGTISVNNVRLHDPELDPHTSKTVKNNTVALLSGKKAALKQISRRSKITGTQETFTVPMPAAILFDAITHVANGDMAGLSQLITLIPFTIDAHDPSIQSLPGHPEMGRDIVERIQNTDIQRRRGRGHRK